MVSPAIRRVHINCNIFSFPLYTLTLTYIYYVLVCFYCDRFMYHPQAKFFKGGSTYVLLLYSITEGKPPIDVFFNTPNSDNSRYWRSQSKTRQQQPSFPPLRPRASWIHSVSTSCVL